ncbi:Signal transducer regulating beta-lactamase production, contains metallopeptidase domain [Ruminococcaceae bacterium YRB3002]|nr:Signal transducer regulating beta-lactamase production, contains metallopeptidase domain [Ruminococcaceae bacterium YRB3002]
MLGDVCYWVINMSIIASVTGLIVLAVRRLGIIPHRFSVFLWLIPFVRMCVPFGLNSPYSLMSLISRLITKTVTVYEATEDIELSAVNTIQAADSYFPITYKVDVLGRVFEIAGFVWVIVALALIIALAILYVTTRREVADAALLERNIRLSDKVDSPAVYGIFRPLIILPSSYADKDLKYIIRHEETHIRRFDNLWRLIGFAVAAVHWFNPLSWVFLKFFLEDLELACDEMTVAGFEPSERKEYALALLDGARSRSLLVSAFGGAKVRTRIENVLSYKKMTLVSAVGSAALIIIIIYTLITNAG